jgi:glycerol-3-phosphate dehydrogenase
VAGIIDGIIPAEDNPDFNPKRKGIVCMQEATFEEKQALIAENPAYANVICRCEMVTEGEILDAIRRPLGATTQDGIKRRTRAGMGRCQSGFCSPKTVEILARELGKDMSEITKRGGKSTFLTGYNKEGM